MRPNRQYFIVIIDKAAQTARRNNLSVKTVPYLGLKFDLTAKKEDKKSLLVKLVVADSPAYNAGFNALDVVHEINNTKVYCFDDVLQIIQSCVPGQEIEIMYSSALYPAGVASKKVTLGSREVKLVLSQVKEMEYNLQYGDIAAIGVKAAEDFPEAEVGDILLFHHSVEYKPRTEGDRAYNDWHYQGEKENGDEYRIAAFDNEVFGVIKVKEGRIIPYRNYVFCHPSIQKASFQKADNGLWLPDAWEARGEELNRQLEELSAQVQEVTSTSLLKQKTSEKNYRKKEEIGKIVSALNKERKEISRKLNQKRLIEATVVFFNPETADILGSSLTAGDKILADMDTLYPLEIGGVHYALARVGYIEALINKMPNC